MYERTYTIKREKNIPWRNPLEVKVLIENVSKISLKLFKMENIRGASYVVL